MQTAGNPKQEEPFIVLDGKNDYCPVIVEGDADQIELAGANRLIDVITSLGGKAEIKSAGSADELHSLGGRAVVLCCRGGTLEKILTPSKTKAPGKGKGWKKESFLVHARAHNGGRYLAIFGDSAGLFYGAMAVADRLHFDGQGNVVTEETEKMYSPALDDRMISTFVIESPNEDYDSSQWKEGEDYNWKKFIDWLAGHRINHLMIQNTCENAGLVYPSGKFPQIVNRDVANVRKEFYSDLIDYAHTRNIKVYLFGFHYPVNALPLIVYPETIAPNCDPANVPGFTSGYGNKKSEFEFRYLLGNYFACLSHPKTREYWKDVTDEVLSMYPQIDGLVIGGAESIGKSTGGAGRKAGEMSERVCECPKCQGMKNIGKTITEVFEVIYKAAMNRKPELDIVVVDRPRYGRLWEHIERQGYDNVSIYWWCYQYPHYPSGFSGKRKKHWDFVDDSWILGKFGGVGHLSKIIKAAVKHRAGLVNMNYWNQEVDIAYAAMSEFSWNPDLTFDRFGELYAIKILRKKHAGASRAIALFAGIMDKTAAPTILFSFRDDDLPVVMEELRELKSLVPDIPDTPGVFDLRRYLEEFVDEFERGLESKNLIGCPDISLLASKESLEGEMKSETDFFVRNNE